MSDNPRHRSSSVIGRIGREPVLIGAAILAWLDVAHPSDLVKAAAVATIAIFVRAYSSPKVAVDEARQEGRDGGIADVASLTSAPDMLAPQPVYTESTTETEEA